MTQPRRTHADVVRDRNERIRKLGLIRVHVCRAFEVDLIDFAGPTRRPREVWCRRLVATLGRELARGSWPEIARVMGRPTHSTIMSNAMRFREELDRDPNQVVAGQRIRNLYLRLKSELEAKFAEAA